MFTADDGAQAFVANDLIAFTGLGASLAVSLKEASVTPLCEKFLYPPVRGCTNADKIGKLMESRGREGMVITRSRRYATH